MQQLHTCLAVTVDTVQSAVNTISNTQQTFCVSVLSLSNSCQFLVSTVINLPKLLFILKQNSAAAVFPSSVQTQPLLFWYPL